MARKASDPMGFDDAPGQQTAIMEDPALAAAHARIADLEKQLEAARGNPGIIEPPQGFGAPRETGFYRVSLQHAPSRIVEAMDAANAFDVWKRTLGVIGSEFPPTVVPATKEEFEFQQEEIKAGRL
jgi:hypothetical protein